MKADVFLDDIETLETTGELLFRLNENEAGIRLMAMALRLRGSVLADLTPVVQRAFLCDIDESAGMAEVVELQGYSKKAPCQ